jgi:hypothetical protein
MVMVTGKNLGINCSKDLPKSWAKPKPMVTLRRLNSMRGRRRLKVTVKPMDFEKNSERVMN